MKSPDDVLYLEHIRECIERIEAYLADLDDGVDFFSDLKTQDAVLRNLQIMAESTQRLSSELKATQPDIAWSYIAGFRNVLVHDYLGVNVTTVWRIILNDLPILKRAVIEMLGA